MRLSSGLGKWGRHKADNGRGAGISGKWDWQLGAPVIGKWELLVLLLLPLLLSLLLLL